MKHSISLPDDNGEKYLIIRTTSLNITEDMSTSAHPIPFTVEVIVDLTCSFGIACNLLSTFIFSRKSMKSLPSLPHIFLLTFDTLFLFALFAKDIVGDCPWVTAWIVILGKTAWTCSVWATLWLFAKFYVDMSSQRTKLIDNNRGVASFHFLILLLAICFNIPHFCLLQQVSWETNLQNNFPCYYSRDVLEKTRDLPLWLVRSELFFEIWCMYLDTAVMFCVPLLFCIIFCIYSQVVLKKIANIQHEMTQHQQTENRLGHLGITYGILFVFFGTYSSVLAFAVPYYYGFLPTCMHAVVYVSYVMVCMNSALKFVIYCAMGKEFRRTLSSLLCNCTFKEATVIKNILKKFNRAEIPPEKPTEC